MNANGYGSKQHENKYDIKQVDRKANRWKQIDMKTNII